MNTPSETPKSEQSLTPRCDSLDLNTLDFNNIRAWRTLARSLESSLQVETWRAEHAEIAAGEWQASYTQEQAKRIAAERSLSELRELLQEAHDKIIAYRKHTKSEYPGGPTLIVLMPKLRAALNKPRRALPKATT